MTMLRRTGVVCVVPLIMLFAAACKGTRPDDRNPALLSGNFVATELFVTERGVRRDLLAAGSRMDFRALGDQRFVLHADIPVAIDTFPPFQDSIVGRFARQVSPDSIFIVTRLGFFFVDVFAYVEPNDSVFRVRDIVGRYIIEGVWRKQ